VSRRASPFVVNGMLALYVGLPLTLCVVCSLTWGLMVVFSR
jgi:hypothetical protein